MKKKNNNNSQLTLKLIVELHPKVINHLNKYKHLIISSEVDEQTTLNMISNFIYMSKKKKVYINILIFTCFNRSTGSAINWRRSLNRNERTYKHLLNKLEWIDNNLKLSIIVGRLQPKHQYYHRFQALAIVQQALHPCSQKQTFKQVKTLKFFFTYRSNQQQLRLARK